MTSTGPKVKFHNATTKKTPKRYALKVETFPLLFTFPRFRISQKATKRENSSEKAREQKQRKSFLSIKKAHGVKRKLPVATAYTSSRQRPIVLGPKRVVAKAVASAHCPASPVATGIY